VRSTWGIIHLIKRTNRQSVICGVEMWRGGLGAAYLFPALSSADASIASPCFRFHIPLIEPDVPVSGIRLSEKTHAIAKATACVAVRNFGKQLGSYHEVVAASWTLMLTRPKTIRTSHQSLFWPMSEIRPSAREPRQ
jgi:hypothetical protein